MTKNGKKAVKLIQNSIVDWQSNWDELQMTPQDVYKVETMYPRPWFDDGDEALNELLSLVNKIENLGSKDLFDAKFKFVRFNMPELFLAEAEELRCWWLLQQPPFVIEIIKRYSDNAAILNRVFYKYGVVNPINSLETEYRSWLNK